MAMAGSMEAGRGQAMSLPSMSFHQAGGLLSLLTFTTSPKGTKDLLEHPWAREEQKWEPKGKVKSGRRGEAGDSKALRTAGKASSLWSCHQGSSNLNTHFGGWANWHPLAWFSADVAAVCSGTQTHSPGE